MNASPTWSKTEMARWKTIGDEAMFVAEGALGACRIALTLVEEFGRGQLPPVRVGLAAGDVLSVFGDVYGPVVRLAARLVAATDPSTVLVSEQVHADATGLFRFEALLPLTEGLSRPGHRFSSLRMKSRLTRDRLPVEQSH
jgi:class 3 adenylate cyclase